MPPLPGLASGQGRLTPGWRKQLGSQPECLLGSSARQEQGHPRGQGIIQECCVSLLPMRKLGIKGEKQLLVVAWPAPIWLQDPHGAQRDPSRSLLVSFAELEREDDGGTWGSS